MSRYDSGSKIPMFILTRSHRKATWQVNPAAPTADKRPGSKWKTDAAIGAIRHQPAQGCTRYAAVPSIADRLFLREEDVPDVDPLAIHSMITIEKHEPGDVSQMGPFV